MWFVFLCVASLVRVCGMQHYVGTLCDAVSRGHSEWRADVLVEGGVIKAIGSDLAVPADATRLDATGKFVMPGTPRPPCFQR